MEAPLLNRGLDDLFPLFLGRGFLRCFIFCFFLLLNFVTPCALEGLSKNIYFLMVLVSLAGVVLSNVLRGFFQSKSEASRENLRHLLQRKAL